MGAIAQHLRSTFLELQRDRKKLMKKWASDVVGNRVRLRGIVEKPLLETLSKSGVHHSLLHDHAVGSQVIAQPLSLMESQVSLERVIRAGRQGVEQTKDYTDESQPAAEHYLQARRPTFEHYKPRELSVDHGYFCSARPECSDDVLMIIKEDWVPCLSFAWEHLESSDIGYGNLIYEFDESQADEYEKAIEALSYMGNVTDHSYQEAADIAVDYYTNIDLVATQKEA